MVDFIRLTMPDISPIVVPTKDIARIIPRLATGTGSRVQCYKQEPFAVLETPDEIGEMLGAACAAPTATEERTSKPVHFTAQDVRDLCNGLTSIIPAILRNRGATVEWLKGEIR